MENLHWQCLKFEELELRQLYDIMHLRQVVFVVEQDCAYLDADGKDTKAWHLCAYDPADNLLAYARLLPEGVSYAGYLSIGRVVTAPQLRGKGMGRPLMRRALSECRRLFGNSPIKISAQYHLRHYYASVGFRTTGEIYDEDGIPHIAMIAEHSQGGPAHA